MSLAITLRSELTKTKRSPIWILTFVAAIIAPALMLIAISETHDGGQPSHDIQKMAKGAWDAYYYQGIGILSFVFLPLFVILTSTLLPQIEYRNHTWKQVLASPQSYGKLYFSKFLIFQLVIIAFILGSLVCIALSGTISAVLNPKFNFYAHPLNWQKMWLATSKAYVAILGLSAIQFWVGIRFKSFLIPMGAGVMFFILGMINMIGYPVIDASKFPITYSGFIYIDDNVAKVTEVLWYSVAYMAVVLVIGFFDFRYKKWD
ncbi:MAG: ABC transporter permease [Pedobacter sp.]|nr:ABC transporter permease [Pedobacter sp.]MDQ8052280.1 ABC transporter permease [Pedobacter sp.]